MSLPRYLFMAEANGMDNLVTTRTAKTNAIINDFKKYIKQGKDINDTMLQENICRQHGLSLNDLTQKEISYIEKKLQNKGEA